MCECTPGRPQSATNTTSFSGRDVSVRSLKITVNRTWLIEVPSAGAKFGAKHAECIFISGPNPEYLGEKIKNTRQLAESLGRDPLALKFFMSFTPILGATEEDAEAKFKDYLKYSSLEGSLAKFCGISGIDLAKFEIDDEFPTDPNDPSLSHLSPKQREVLTIRPDGYSSWTPRILGEGG